MIKFLIGFFLGANVSLFLYYRKVLFLSKKEEKIKGIVKIPQKYKFFEVKRVSCRHFEYRQDYNHRT